MKLCYIELVMYFAFIYVFTTPIALACDGQFLSIITES